jgi:transcriptional regulator with XRE-family HTH domain
MTRNRTRDQDGSPNPTDLYVGKRLRARRTMLGLTQEKLSEVLGLTFQQIQKYERGTNRIGASRLLELSSALTVPVGYFFEELEPEVAGLAERKTNYAAPTTPTLGRDALELLRLFQSIEDAKLRRDVLRIVKSVAKTGVAE